MSTRSEYIEVMADRMRRGVASLGARCWFGDEDLGAECRARAEAYGAVRSAEPLVRTFAWTPAEESARTRKDLLDGLRSRLVHAYAAVWGPVKESDSRSGQPIWRSLGPDSFGVIDPDTVPLLRDHDGEPIGWFIDIRADDFGLRTAAIYDDTPAGRKALDDIRAGRLACYSVRVATREAVPLAETRDGLPMHEVVRATLLDAGPASGIGGNPFVGPADTRARILAVGGQPVDPVAAAAHRAMRTPDGDPDMAELDAMSVSQLADEIAWFVGGDRLRELSDAIGYEARRKREACGEQVRRIERAVSALRKARTSAEHSYTWWLRRGRHPADWREFTAFDAEADGHEAWLREHTYADTYRVLTAGIPPKVTLRQRLRDLATDRHRR